MASSSGLLKSTLAALSIAMPFAAAADPNPLVAERWKTRPVVVVVPQRGPPTTMTKRSMSEIWGISRARLAQPILGGSA